MKMMVLMKWSRACCYLLSKYFCFVFKKFESFENLLELSKTRLSLKSFLKVYQKFCGLAEFSSWKKITQKKLPQKTVSVITFSQKFLEHFQVFKTQNLPKLVVKTEIYQSIQTFIFAKGDTFSLKCTEFRNSYWNAWP